MNARSGLVSLKSALLGFTCNRRHTVDIRGCQPEQLFAKNPGVGHNQGKQTISTGEERDRRPCGAPVSTKKPTLQKSPAKKELKGKLPTSSI